MDVCVFIYMSEKSIRLMKVSLSTGRTICTCKSSATFIQAGDVCVRNILDFKRWMIPQKGQKQWNEKPPLNLDMYIVCCGGVGPTIEVHFFLPVRASRNTPLILTQHFGIQAVITKKPHYAHPISSFQHLSLCFCIKAPFPLPSTHTHSSSLYKRQHTHATKRHATLFIYI